jgi:hypothetical protein
MQRRVQEGSGNRARQSSRKPSLDAPRLRCRVPHPSFLRRVGGFVEAPGVIPLRPVDRGVTTQNNKRTPVLPSAGTEKFSMSRFVGHGFSRAKKKCLPSNFLLRCPIAQAFIPATMILPAVSNRTPTLPRRPPQKSSISTGVYHSQKSTLGA